MVHKYLSQEEKARILAWRQENVPIKEIVRRSGRPESMASYLTFVLSTNLSLDALERLLRQLTTF